MFNRADQLSAAYVIFSGVEQQHFSIDSPADYYYFFLQLIVQSMCEKCVQNPKTIHLP